MGVGAQKFLHAGTRLMFGRVMFEGDVGIMPWVMSRKKTYSSYTVGAGLIPDWEHYAGGNFNISMLYSLAKNIDKPTDFYRILTANFGWVKQHSPGLSILMRAGIGIINGNNYIQDDRGGYIWKRDLVPWGNVEGSIGYAF